MPDLITGVWTQQEQDDLNTAFHAIIDPTPNGDLCVVCDTGYLVLMPQALAFPRAGLATGVQEVAGYRCTHCHNIFPFDAVALRAP